MKDNPFGWTLDRALRAYKCDGCGRAVRKGDRAYFHPFSVRHLKCLPTAREGR